jgi:hypothetical protein
MHKCPRINEPIYKMIDMFPLFSSLIFDFLYTYQSVPITQFLNSVVRAIEYFSWTSVSVSVGR